MTTSKQVPDDALASLVAVASACLAAAPDGLADDAMVAVRDAELMGRLADTLRVRAAGMVAAESAAEYGAEGLSRRNGFATPAKFLAALTGTSEQTARTRLQLSEVTRSTVSLVGTPNPSRFPVVEAALREGALGVDAAVVITRRLGEVAKRCGFTEGVRVAEESLVAAATRTAGGLSYSANEVNVLGYRVADWLDPDGARPVDETAHRDRALTLTDGHKGSWFLTASLPNEHGIALRTLLDSLVSPRVRPCFEDVEPDLASSAIRDPRTHEQRLFDAFADIISAAAASPGMPHINGAAPTINVHADLSDVVTGRAVGWVDGLPAPLSAPTVAQLLCNADLVTTLFGDAGQVLQHGKTRRLFTPAQRRAMAARDGGCVWPGCDRPPSWCESHHVQEWTDGSFLPGRTDVDNGVLLCHYHHHNLHHADYQLRMIGGTPHAIPPTRLDWQQTPIPCTRQRTRARNPHWKPPPP